MPSKSPRQKRFMAAAAHDPAFAARADIDPAVAQEFNDADAGIEMRRPKRRSKSKALSNAITGAMSTTKFTV